MKDISWKIWIDTGGTFTDCIAIAPDQSIKRLKIPSNSSLKGKVIAQPNKKSVHVQLQWPTENDIYRGFTLFVLGKTIIKRKVIAVDLALSIVELDKPITKKLKGFSIELTSEEEVPVLASRLLTATSLTQEFPAIEMKLGSTKGTNAILERKGAKTGLIITKGFKDLLTIGTQQRPDLFALSIQKAKPLYDVVEEVEERIESDGSVLEKLNRKHLKKIIRKFKRQKVESVAIALLNSYKNPKHELEVSRALLDAGFSFISTAHELSRQVKILQRAETAVANAYLAPIIFNYLNRIQSSLKNASLKIMTSAGGLISADQFFPKDSLLSGPAGGVVGAATSGKRSGHTKLITFDMGGTSTDVSLYNNRFDYRYESHVGATKILSPSLSIETIAAGGGSICSFDGYKFSVGPHSAGAYPGPACYGAGGPLTITDVNLLLGRVNTSQFSVPLHRDKAEQELLNIVRLVNRHAKRKLKDEEILHSFLQIANEKMADAIRKVSLQQGHNPADFTLLSFGGAGGQHACQLARMLNMKKILIPYDAGLLSAYGIGHARIERFAEKLIVRALSEVNNLKSECHQLFLEGCEKLQKEGFVEEEISLDKQLVFLRFKGQESSLEVEYDNDRQLLKDFKKKYESIFGHWLSDRTIEVESIRVMVSVAGYTTRRQTSSHERYLAESKEWQYFFAGNKRKKIKLFQWEQLRSGAQVFGPAIVSSQNSTTVVEEGWSFFLDANHHALLTSESDVKANQRHDEAASIELYSNRFTAIAQDMGALLQRTSFSVNVKERLDFSCAVMDAEGYLIVNAPHIPVHLGSMGVCVREVAKVVNMKEGDVIITNHPAFGGSHLPDVTLIKPVFVQKKLIGYVANRAHHAEIGGKKPGSMPANARYLQEEGVIISPTWLVKNGQACWDEIKSIFLNAHYPTRLIEENLADLNGALASVNLGEAALQELCVSYRSGEVKRHMMLLKHYAAQLLSQKLKSSKTNFAAIEYLDDGSTLSVKLSARNGKLFIDFTGSAKQHVGNLNATKAIVQSVVLYCLRMWVNQPIAMNEGLLEHVKIILPQGLLNPDFSIAEELLPAVVGGNTEISQRLTDTILKALKLCACSQGTMNNVLFGNEKFGYYETIGGGAGAGNGFDGADAVHTHMTNTRITDPEILELRYPVRLDSFSVRRNSGGKGKWSGGNGIIRAITFKETIELNLLTQHRQQKPYGINGGQPGKPGRQYILKKDKEVIHLKGVDSISVESGDTLIIETPGGGGWGK